MKRTACLVVLAVLAGSAVACAPTRASRPAGSAPVFDVGDDGPFPTASEVEALAQQPVMPGLFAGRRRVVEHWELTGPLPVDGWRQTHDGKGPLVEFIKPAVERSGGRLTMTESAHCVAREVGQFILATGQAPEERLMRFMGAMCGTLTAQPAVGFLTLELKRDASTAEIVETLRPQLENMVRPLSADDGDLGVWFGRKGPKVVAAVVRGNWRMRLTRAELVPGDDGNIHLEGRLLTAGDVLEAHLNNGPFRVTNCAPDPDVALPAFKIACAADVSSGPVWLDVGVTLPGRRFASPVLETLVMPRRAVPLVFNRQAPLGTAQERAPTLEESILAALNGVRASAGVPPLELAAAQSRTAHGLAGRYFSVAMGQEPPEVMDQALAALLAGYNVEGNIHQAGFASGLTSGAGDVEQLVAAMLERPFDRAALLDPDVHQAAIGVIPDEGSDTLAALVGVYSLMERQDPEALATRVWMQVQSRRAARGLPGARRLAKVDRKGDAIVTRLEKRQVTPGGAFQQLLDGTADALTSDVEGWILATGTLQRLELPDEVLARKDLEMVVKVARYRNPDKPWGRFVILLAAEKR